jgi:hypothetical protein
VRELAAQAHLAHCEVGCSACPAAAEHPHAHEREETPRPYLIAAE